MPPYVLAEMRKEAIDNVLRDFAEEWCVSLDAVSYAADRYQFGDTDLPGLNNLKKSADFDSYSAKHEGISKFKYHQCDFDQRQRAVQRYDRGLQEGLDRHDLYEVYQPICQKYR